MKNKKLKVVAVLGAITVISSIGISSVNANAGAFIPRASSSNSTTGGSGFLSRLRSGFTGIWTGLTSCFRGRTTSGNGTTSVTAPSASAQTTSHHTNSSFDGDGGDVTYANLSLTGTPGGLHPSNIDGGNKTIYTTVKGSGGGSSSGLSSGLKITTTGTGGNKVETVDFGNGNKVTVTTGDDGIERYHRD